MGTRPSGYHDWTNVGEWLGMAAGQVATPELVLELQRRPRSAWARAAYLLDAGGQGKAARVLLSKAPAGRGPYYLGDREGGRYVSPFEVIDNIGLRAGSGDH